MRRSISLVTALLTLIATGTLLALHYQLGPLDGLTYDRGLLVAAPALAVLAIAGILWLVLVVASVKSKEWRTWEIAVSPIFVALAAAVVLFIPAEGFEDARPDMERIAEEILATPGSSQSNIKIGKIAIAKAEERDDGAVYFFDSDRSFGSTRGWIYSPDGRPVGTKPFIALTPLGGPWYEFEYGT